MNTKSNRIWNILSSLVLALTVGAEALLLWRVYRLYMVPERYFLAICGGVLLVTGLLCLLLFPVRRGKGKQKSGIGRRMFGYLFCALLTAVCWVGGSVVGQVLGTISAITAPEKINVVLEVYVRHDDPAQYVQDAGEYSFAISSDVPEEDIDRALEELNSLLGKDVSITSYPSTIEALSALLTGETNAVILNTEYLSVMGAVDGFEEVTSKIRSLHELVIEKEVVRKTKPSLPLRQEADVLSAPFLIYISGNDALRPLLADGGSDVNILMLVNVQNRQVLLINTPRDYYVVNPASGDGSRDKLSHCGLRGIDNCIGALTELYGIPITHYARINFYGFKTLVDAIGGVTVYSDISFNTYSYLIHKGENYLNGDQALEFARERKNLAGGDNDRGKNQMRLISAMIQQLSMDNLIANYSEILASLEGMFATNFPAEDIGKLVQFQLTEMPSWEILTFAVTGDNGHNYCWGVNGSGYVMYPHENVVAHAIDLMERFLDGERLTQADMTVNP